MIRHKRFPYVLGLLFLLMIAAFVFPFVGGSAQDNPTRTRTSQILSRNLPNYDAFGASTGRTRAAADNSAQNVSGPQSEGGHMVQVESRLAVPTFLWASDPGPAQPAAALKAAPEQLSVKGGGGAESVAREHLSRYASRYRLSSADIANARVASVHDTGKGPIIVKLKQQVGGVEVFRDEVAIIMNRDLQLIAISGYLTGDNTDLVPAFSLQSTDAISKALTDLTGQSFDPAILKNQLPEASTSGQSDPYQYFTASNTDTPGFVLSERLRAKPVMYHMIDEYVPAYYIETIIEVPVADSKQVDLSGNPGTRWETEAYSYVISAVDGKLLFRKNLVQNDSYTYRVWADPTTLIPYDNPSGNGVHPNINGVPDGTQYPFVATNDITLQNFPFSRNDPWLAPAATETVGNNVDAYLDLVNPDGYSPPTDFRGQVTAPGEFLHTHTPDANITTSDARQGSLQQLFYDINFLHDWYYEAGFDEASGNAQLSNYGRGGAQNDRIKAEGQDVSKRNNADMNTPSDGTSPRMQMYVFDSTSQYVDVLSPPAAAGQRPVGNGQFGAQIFDVTNSVVQPSPAHGCTAGSFAGTAGKFVLVDREPTATCSIGTKLNNAMAAGAAGFILVNLSTTPTTLVNVTGSLPTFTIPFLTITWNSAISIKTELAVPNVVTVRMRRDSDRDGTIDNQIIFHEWGHYISNRLIGNSYGIFTQQSSGMGEGWGDFTAMLLTVRQDDASVPTNATFNGPYALATYATSGGTNNGYYFGIRRYPYSTDMTKNPLTLKHIADGNPLPAGPPVNGSTSGTNNSEAHNTGEVWTTMLWECYASLLRDTQGASPRLTFHQAQERMKYYLVAAYKMTPAAPTFLEARDALLAAAIATDQVDYQRFWTAFAKRGAGYSAQIPNRYTINNNPVTEDFTTPSDAIFTGAALDDIGAGSCDNDGVLDSGETGHLVFTLRNTGLNSLTTTTGTVTTTSPGITFPNGNALVFSPSNPGSNTTATVDIAFASGIVGIKSLDFQLNYYDPQFVAPHTNSVSLRANTNTIPASTATETVEPLTSVWSTTSAPPIGIASPFRRKEVTSLQHVWHADDSLLSDDEQLNSPVFVVNGGGSFNLQFDHSWGFEFDGGGNYDGGVVEISVNGGAFTDFGTGSYNGTILNYSGDLNPLKGRSGYVQNSAGTIHTSLTQAIAPGSTVQIRFRAGSDANVGGAGWDIDNIAFTGVVETPFGTLVADPGGVCGPGVPPGGVTLQLTPNTLPTGTINTAYSTTALVPSGGTGPYTFKITPFGTPQGLVYDVVSGNLQISGTPTTAGTFPITIEVKDSASHQANFNYSITINKIFPTITWNNPADITYPTALGATQLNASTGIPGTFTYTPVSTTVLNAGNAQNLHVDFVPTDNDTYANASKDVSINVLQATPTITWNNPADITYPTALSGTQLNATASVPGAFTYTPAAATVLNGGNGQNLHVDFVPTDTTNYSNASKDVSINVLKVTPTITWNNPADITYPTALGATQLNATASVPGAFTYTPAAATVLNAGNAQNLHVDFVPTDTTNYNNASKNVSINVLKVTPTITWNNPADISPATALSATQLNATASVPGAFTYTPPAGTMLATGSAQVLHVDFVPTDTTNYNNASKNVFINVTKIAPTITWGNPADIIFGTALGATQLNATANAPGAFTYTPAAGTVLNAGNAQVLHVDFVPTDTASYDNASKNVAINVLKATPTITWGNPADIIFGTALGATQLNATPSVPGVLTYTPAAGTVLNTGNNQVLHVDFVPTDTVNYNNASKNVSINVLKVTPTITWNNPADIIFGTALGATQLNATASVPGVLTYTPASGTVINAGSNQVLHVDFVPTDTANFNNASKNVAINVTKATPTITWNNPADIVFGTALGAAQLNATASVPGVLTYTPAAGTVLNAGNNQLLAVNFVPTDTANYTNASKNVSINVGRATPSINWNTPADITFGTAIGATQLNATANVPGTFNYTPVAGTVFNVGNTQALVLDFAPTDTANYENAAKYVWINVVKANQTITFGALINRPLGSAPFGVSGTSTSGLALSFSILSGPATINNGVITLTGLGTVTVRASQAGNGNYNAATPVDQAFTVTSPPNGVIQFSSANYSVGEAAGSVVINVTRTGDTTQSATLDYATNDGSTPGTYVPCATVNGAARERCDFTPALGTLQFAAGETSKSFTVLVTDDVFVEGAETLQLILSNPSAGALLGSLNTATLSITDNDLVGSPNPVDDAIFFVTQLYHDFLNRVPDNAGLTFWTGQITSCGANQTCISQARTNVAAAFFLSIEFQQTGYLVERLNKTAYGSPNGSSTLGGVHNLPVPVVRVNEFLPDTQKIGLGVVVGNPGWEAALENNKQAFVNEFVLRTRFTTAYPGGQTAAAFVDTLNTNAGNPLSVAERNQLVSDLTGGIKTRAQVVRAIAEHQNLISAEFNRAFVLMQFFGFLRRNPNDLPDTDYTGFDFWLSKLNEFNGNYVDAQLVTAFINSAEYRQRFGN